MSKETHDKIKAELAQLDQIKAERDSLRKKLQQVTEAFQLANIRLKGLADRQELTDQQNGFYQGVIEKQKLQIGKLEENMKKNLIVLNSYKTRNAELLQEVQRQKSFRRKMYVHNKNTRVWILVGLSGWISAMIIGITNK